MPTNKMTRMARYLDRCSSGAYSLGKTNSHLAGLMDLSNRRNSCWHYNPRLVGSWNLDENLALPFLKTSIMSNCTLNPYLYAHRWVQLLPIIKEASFLQQQRWWQKATHGQNAESNWLCVGWPALVDIPTTQPLYLRLREHRGGRAERL